MWGTPFKCLSRALKNSEKSRKFFFTPSYLTSKQVIFEWWKSWEYIISAFVQIEYLAKQVFKVRSSIAFKGKQLWRKRLMIGMELAFFYFAEFNLPLMLKWKLPHYKSRTKADLYLKLSSYYFSHVTNLNCELVFHNL